MNWMEYVKKNFSQLKSAVNTVDEYGRSHIRNIIAEMGYEMTPQELEDIVELLKMAIDKLEREGYNE